MLEIKTKIKARRGAYAVTTRGTLRLPFHQRQKSRLHTRLESGEEVALALPRGEILRGGDLVVASDGRVIEVQAETERVVHVECDTPAALARCAYLLGSRHVPVEVGERYLRLAADPVLEEMLRDLGARLSARDVPFEPEAGAYAGGHQHDHDETGHGGRIHGLGEHRHEHEHSHDHAPGHDHDHAHCDDPHHRHRPE